MVTIARLLLQRGSSLQEQGGQIAPGGILQDRGLRKNLANLRFTRHGDTT